MIWYEMWTKENVDDIHAKEHIPWILRENGWEKRSSIHMLVKAVCSKFRPFGCKGLTQNQCNEVQYEKVTFMRHLFGYGFSLIPGRSGRVVSHYESASAAGSNIWSANCWAENTHKSSRRSPTPISLMGSCSSWVILRTTPPLAVPSSLAIINPVKLRTSWNWRAWLMAFWPIPDRQI